MQFLNHMRLSAKFLLLGILALLMVALPTGLYFQNAWGSAAFARQEASGRDAVVALNRTIQTLQSHRGLAAGALGGNESLAQRRPAMRDQVVKNIEQLDAELKTFGASEETLRFWNEFRQQWPANPSAAWKAPSGIRAWCARRWCSTTGFWPKPVCPWTRMPTPIL